MKKFVVSALLLIFSFILIACGDNGQVIEDKDKQALLTYVNDVIDNEHLITYINNLNDIKDINEIKISLFSIEKHRVIKEELQEDEFFNNITNINLLYPYSKVKTETEMTNLNYNYNKDKLKDEYQITLNNNEKFLILNDEFELINASSLKLKDIINSPLIGNQLYIVSKTNVYNITLNEITENPYIVNTITYTSLEEDVIIYIEHLGGTISLTVIDESNYQTNENKLIINKEYLISEFDRGLLRIAIGVQIRYNDIIYIRRIEIIKKQI